jgi:hypothetical protein
VVVPNFRHELNVIFDGEFDPTVVVVADGFEGAGAAVDEPGVSAPAAG